MPSTPTIRAATAPPGPGSSLISPLQSSLPGAQVLIKGLAVVASIKAAQVAGSTHAIQISMRGSLGDACTQLGDIAHVLKDHAITVTVQTLRPEGRMCAQMLKDFETSVTVDMTSQPAGAYLIVANDVTTTLVYMP